MCMKRMYRSWDTNSTGLTSNSSLETNNSVPFPGELTAISSGLVFLFVVAIVWVPIMWIFCRGEKNTESSQDQDKENNSDYRSFDEISGVDNQGFVDIDLREYQDQPSTSSGIYHKTSPQILNASTLENSMEMWELDGKKQIPNKKTKILNHVSSFIKNAVCNKTRPDDKTVAVNTIYKPDFQKSLNFKRTMSLPARLKISKWPTVRNVIMLRAQTPEDEPKREEASTFCCAFILKNLESQGYFDESTPKIKITELSKKSNRDESGTVQFSFRVQVSKFPNRGKQNEDDTLVMKKKSGSKENITVVFERDMSVQSVATAVDELCGKSTMASVSVYGGTLKNTLRDEGIETIWNICLVDDEENFSRTFERKKEDDPETIDT